LRQQVLELNLWRLRIFEKLACA
jgi:hypothetical protein